MASFFFFLPGYHRKKQNPQGGSLSPSVCGQRHPCQVTGTGEWQGSSREGLTVEKADKHSLNQETGQHQHPVTYLGTPRMKDVSVVLLKLLSPSVIVRKAGESQLRDIPPNPWQGCSNLARPQQEQGRTLRECGRSVWCDAVMGSGKRMGKFSESWGNLNKLWVLVNNALMPTH